MNHLFKYAFFLILSFSLWKVLQAEEDLLTQANKNYELGEQAQTLLDRKRAFNQALSQYLDLEKQKAPNVSSQLNQALANTFFQLGEYPRSIYYNYRALALDPHHSIIWDHLQLAQQKLDLNPTTKFPLYQQILSFFGYLPLPQRFEFFFWLTIFTFAIVSCWIWMPSFPFKSLAQVFGVLTCLMVINLLVSFYFIPIEGVLIQPTGLYREPESNDQLLSQPLMAGIKVQVLEVMDEGKWLKIKDNDQVGYIPYESIKLI